VRWKERSYDCRVKARMFPSSSSSKRTGHRPHGCSPPSTAELVGREMDFECRCGRRWRLEHYFGKDGSLLGPSLL
jgi:hypothetical protein